MDCRTVLEEMAARFDGAAAGEWRAVFQLNISGDKGGDFVVRVADGACTLADGPAADATSTIVTGDETWLGIIAGTINPMAAFMTGKIKVSGNVGDVLKLQDPQLFRRG